MPGTSFSTANWAGYDAQTVTNPDSALTDFTLIIDIANLSSDWADEVQSDGGDIRVTDGDDTELAFDLIDWDYNSGDPTGLIRCLWSGSLATSGDQTVKVWAGYTGGTATAYDDDETYGADNAYDSDRAGYWPLEEGSGTLYDRTSNANDMTAGGSIAYGQTGKVGSCVTADALGEYLQTDDLLHSSPHALTWGAWFYITNASPSTYSGRLFSQRNSGGEAVWVNTDGAITFYVHGSTTMRRASSDSSVSEDTWQHIVATWDGSTTASNVHIYVNGEECSYQTTTDGASLSGYDSEHGFSVCIESGRSTLTQLYASADEIFADESQRSAAWIAEEYAQTNDNATFWGSWSWTAQSGGGSVVPIILQMHY